MYVAYFSECTWPRQRVASRVLRRAAAYHRVPAQPARDQGRNYLLSQQQAIYDQLVAHRIWTLESNPSAALPSQVPLSAAEITRDLAGWTSPLAGAGQLSQRAVGQNQ